MKFEFRPYQGNRTTRTWGARLLADGTLLTDEAEMALSTADALRAEIVIWEGIVRFIEANPHEVLKFDVVSTPLCNIFHASEDRGGQPCVPCPIYAHTGKHDCRHTPVDRYITAENNNPPDRVPVMLKHAKEQLALLKEIE